MRHMAASDFSRPLGCTQSTEIINTSGVELSGSLPKGCELSTIYTAAVATGAVRAREAQLLIDLLIGADQDKLRQRAGFLDAPK
jgi:molybdate transport system substrate-binding protein